MSQYVWLVPIFPILAVLINGLLGRRYIRDKAHYLAIGSVGLSLAVSLGIFWEVAFHGGGGDYIFYQWIFAGPLSVNVGFLVDPLSSIMLLIVCGVGFLIHIYSAGYMHGDPGYYRFFTYLNLFMVSMLILVLGDNYLLMFVGWEGVGLCSYLLIGFYFERKSAADAGKKAFVVNRIGDAGFLLGIFLIFAHLGSLSYSEVFARAGHLTTGVATAITLCLFLGAVGKSAQIPLYVWLPDAMEGPTPVSALIHAATMVTAGVYMVARSHVLYELAPFSMTVVAIVGGFTALFAASIGLLQNDIKRVLAYSTVSQLGYMFLACGVGAFTAGIFHLMTHAFFKALLFLGSGSVIHGLSGEQDMRKMGALRHHMPRTFITFVIATIAIAGIPPFAGFFSKDEILWQTFSSPNGHWILWLIGAVAAGMTAFYMSRLVFMTFFGESRVDEHAAHHLHESPNNMTVPLMILAFLSIVGGWVGIPAALGGNNHIHHFLEPSLGAHQGAATTVGHGAVAEVVHGATATGAHGVAETAHGAVAVAHGAAAHHPPIFVEYLLMLISIGIALGGIALAYQLYLRRPELPTHLSQRFSTAYDAILNKYYVDEIYAYLVINPTKRLCQALWRFDMNVVDGAVNGTGWLTVWNSITSGRFDTFAVDGAVNGISMLIKGGGRAFRRFHTGLVQNYALAMFLGIFFLVSLYLFS